MLSAHINELYKYLKSFLGKRIISIYSGNEVMIKQIDQQIIQKQLVDNSERHIRFIKLVYGITV